MLKLRHRSGIKFVLVALPVIAFLLLGIPTSHAALTFSGTSVTGDSATGIDTAGTLTIGGSSATGIVLGRTGIQTSLPGSVTVTGNATTTALSITSLAGAGGCLSVSASGLISTSTCGGAFTAGGDLTGSASSQTVAKIQGNAVTSTAPTSGQVLTWNGTFWAPAAVATGTGVTSINNLSSSTFVFSGSGANQITVATSGTNVITWSLPQNIGTTSLPAFGGLAVTGNATTTALSITSLAGTTGCLSVSASGLVTTSTCSGASGVTSLNNLTGLVVATGTANEITVASGTGQVVISTPQAIAVTSAPTFAGITLTGNATTTNLTIAGLGSSGSPCLTVSASGLVSTSTCGSGGFTAGGDLTGSASSQTVAKIQGNAVTSTAPSVNQVLAWNGTSWVPTSVAGTGTVTTSSAITANNFPFWVTAGGGLSGTSTLTVTGTTLTQSSALNVGGNLNVTGTAAFASTTITGNATTTALSITGLATASGNPCLVVSATGAVSTSTCGTGGGIGGSGTANQIAEFNTSSSITGIAIGSNGTVLTSNGATSSFQAIPGITLNGLLTPNGNATYNMQGNQFTLQGFSGNGSQNLFTLLDASSDTSNGYAIGVSTTVMNPASFLANGNGLVIASTGLSTFNKGIVQSGGLVSLASTTIAGQATTTALSITGLAGATGCLSVSASGAVTTSTCSGGSLSGGQSNYVPLWTGAGTLGTSTLQAAATSLVTVGGLAVGTTTNQAAGNLLVTGNATTTNLSIASLAGTSGCLSVSASGAVATSSCSSSGGSVSTSSAITASDFPFWSSVSGGLSGTSSLYVASSNGYIGVNDTNPLHGLEIAGNSSATVLTATPTDIGILNTNSSTNNDYSGISFLTYDVNGSELLDSKIEGIATSHASGTVSGQLSFFTRNSGTNQDDFDILPAGNANFLGPINDSSTLTVSSSISAANIYEPFATSTATTSSTVINWSRSNKQWVLMNVATTAISFSNIQNGASYSLWIMQNATGSETVSWQSTGSGRIVWPGGTAPTLTTTANDMDEVSFQCFTPSTTSTLSCYGANGSGNWGQ